MSVVRAPGVNPDGTLGVRGWRGLCGCLWLGQVTTYNMAAKELEKHRKTCAHHQERCSSRATA